MSSANVPEVSLLYIKGDTEFTCVSFSAILPDWETDLGLCSKTNLINMKLNKIIDITPVKTKGGL